jgi:hypothetical protein
MTDKLSDNTDEKYQQSTNGKSKWNTTAMSTISINEMHPYEKVMEIMKEFPNLNETVGSTSNNLYSGDEFDED